MTETGDVARMTHRQRAKMCLCPCTYLCKPDIASEDCCLCCHLKYEKELEIADLVEMAGT